MLTPNDPIVKSTPLKLLNAAKLSDQRHRLHAEAVDGPDQASPYWRKLRDGYFAETIASPAVFNLFLRQIVWPLVSVELVDDIADASAAVHHAQDRFIGVELTDETLQADFEQYLEALDLNAFIARDCHNQLFYGPSALVVVDLPSQQTTPFPEPYVYILPTDKVERAEAGEDGLMKWVQFQADAKLIALYDEQDFGLFQKNESGSWEQLLMVAHSLEHAPVFRLWADTDPGNPLLSNSVLSPILGLLDRYVLWDGAREVNDLGAGFQMFWHFREEPQSCGYTNEHGDSCQGGFVVSYVDGESVRTSCGRCGTKKPKYGPGVRIPIPAPNGKEDADWRAPAGWISPEVDALKYVAEKVAALKTAIKSTATGQQVGPENKQALNADQIFSILEASRRVGQYLATNYETLHRRLIDTIGRLRYGSAYVGCSVNYGRRFTALSGDQLMTLYESAKTIGALWLLEEIDGMLQDYYARSDASRKLRYQLLTDLNPYPYMSAADLVAAQLNTTDPIGYRLSVGLMRYVRRFEAENNVPIERFGVLIDYSQRVTTIIQTLTEYVKTDVATSRPDPANPAGSNGDNSDPANGDPDPNG